MRLRDLLLCLSCGLTAASLVSSLPFLTARTPSTVALLGVLSGFAWVTWYVAGMRREDALTCLRLGLELYGHGMLAIITGVLLAVAVCA